MYRTIFPDDIPTRACVGGEGLEGGGANEEQVGVPRSEGLLSSPACWLRTRLKTEMDSSYPPESSVPGTRPAAPASPFLRFLLPSPCPDLDPPRGTSGGGAEDTERHRTLPSCTAMAKDILR